MGYPREDMESQEAFDDAELLAYMESEALAEEEDEDEDWGEYEDYLDDLDDLYGDYAIDEFG